MPVADGDHGPVAKLVLLQQACCDKRLKGERSRNRGSHVGVLAVILDACHGKPRCWIGPTRIGEIAGLNEKTVRDCIKELEAFGYVRSEPRSERSRWLYPNFQHSKRSGCLHNKGHGDQLQVYRPVNPKALLSEIADLQSRSYSPVTPARAGAGTRASGSERPSERVYTPEEAVEESISEAVAPLMKEQQRKQRPEHDAARRDDEAEKAASRGQYARLIATHGIEHPLTRSYRAHRPYLERDPDPLATVC